jgi:Tfp pilus assembly protein PilF
VTARKSSSPSFPGFMICLVITCVLSACATGPEKRQEFVIEEEIEVRPEVRADFKKAVAMLENEEYERGLRLLTRISERSEKSIAPYINLGIAYQKTGDMKKAELSLEKALKLNPNHPAANNEMGMVYRKTGKFSQARRTYERVLERYPNFYPARKNLGILCDLYIKDLRCALANYEIYNKADPGDKSVAIWIVDLRKRMKE